MKILAIFNSTDGMGKQTLSKLTGAGTYWGRYIMFLEDNFTTVSDFLMHGPSNPAILKSEIYTMAILMKVTQTMHQRHSLKYDL